LITLKYLGHHVQGGRRPASCYHREMPKSELADPRHRILLAWPAPRLDQELRALVEQGLAGLVFPGDALADREAAAAFCHELQQLAGEEPLLLAAEDEQGKPWLPPELDLSDPAMLGFEYEEDGEGIEIQLQAIELGRALAARGLTYFRGPRLDLARSGERGNQDCFGGEPNLVAEVGSSYIESLQAAGVIAAAGAFPGRGALAGRLGAEDILRFDAAPFLAAAGRGLEVFEMAAGSYPAFGEKKAALNEDLIEWLREDIGFRGVIASPPLEELGEDLPALAREAADAGCNLLYLRHSEKLEAVLAALAPKTALERKLATRHATRIRKLRLDWLAE
jgi:beta-glucosidase-like glycosyl hydrolase